MDIEQIQTLIANGESKTIEYKQSVAELEKLGKTLCGMLNTQGGHGFIGITDAGRIIGTEVSDSTRKKLTEFHHHFDPRAEITIEYVNVPKNRFVISMTCVFSKKNGPYTFKGRAYIKTESGIEPMPSEKYQKLLLEHAGLSKAWESMNALNHSINDLDHDEIIKTAHLGLKEGRMPADEYSENVIDILTHFDLIQNGILNNAAMVVFAKKMPSDYSQCFIRLGRFTDDTMDVALDSKQIRGNAFQILSEAQDFINRHLPIASHYSANQFERVDEAALPFLAVREAIINAICHRDYSKRAGDISLIIFNDRLEIHNIGHLYGDLTIEQLSQSHPSRRRNEKIAQVFYTRGLIDRWGGGTRRILRLCREKNLAAPQFAEVTDGFLVQFFFKESIGPYPKTTSLVVNNGPLLDIPQRELHILQILAAENHLPSKKIADRLNTTVASRTIRDNLAHLKSIGLIDFTGVGRGTKWFLVKNPLNETE